jgi:hypothetical protein
MKKIYLVVLSFCLTALFTPKGHSTERKPATNILSDQVDDFVREVDALEGKAGEELSKDRKKTEVLADKIIEKVLFFNQKENKQKLDRPEDFAVCLYHLTKNPSFSKNLRDVVQAKVLLHPQKKILEKIIHLGEEATKGEEPPK